MPNINRVILAGHLTRDPELRFSPKGTAFAKFGIAVNRKWRGQGGEEKEEVCFVDCDSFGKQAETIGGHFRKGNAILIEGRLKTDSWEDKQSGQKRSKIVVQVESFHFVDARERETQPSEPKKASQPVAAKADTDDDVPF